MEYLFLSLIFSSFIFFFFCLHFLRPIKRHHVGGFQHYPLVGVLPEFLANRHRFLDWTTAVLTTSPTNTACFWRPGDVPGVLTANPANVEHVLKTNFPNYPKGNRFIHTLRDLLGSGIVNSDDELWLHQRKISTHEFSKRSLRNFVVKCVRSEICNRLLPLLSDAAKSGNRVLDLQEVFELFGFDSICKLTFNVDPHSLSVDGSEKPEFMKAFVESATLISGRLRKVLPIIWRIQRFFNIGSENRLLKSIRTIHQFANDITKSRLLEKQEKGKGFNSEEDLLSRFIATDENSPEFLRDVVIGNIIAGKDSSSSALTWLFWLLSSHPNVVSKIRSEVDRVRTRFGTRRGESFDYDEIREMQYLHAALSEAMRLYPPIPVDTKVCRNDDVLPDGTVVKKGWFVTYHIFAMGRMKLIWGEDCEEFRPERWMVGSESGGFTCKVESPFKYPVFNGGPRVCLGREMAFIQMKSIVASVLESFDLDMVEKEKSPECVMALTLRMKDGLSVKLKFRN